MELAGIEPASAECALAFIGIETFPSPVWLSIPYKDPCPSFSVDRLIFFHKTKGSDTLDTFCAVYSL